MKGIAVVREGALARLMKGLRREPHDFRASLDVFPALDPQVVARDLGLEKLGRGRGSIGEPPSASATLDEIEMRIVDRVEAERKAAHAILLDQLHTYDERLANLDFEGRFSEIRQAAPAAVSEFKAEAATGRDELNRLRRALKEHEEEKEAFKREHRLTRAPHPPSAGAQTLKFGFIAILLLVETVLNGTFLAKGSELGLVGGTTEAFAFALLNVLGSFLFGRIGLPQLVHRGLLHKLIGLFALLAWFVFALALNLALAHYREVSGQLLESGGSAVIARLTEAPLSLTDIKSWLFFGIGFFFSVAALIDGTITVDPYPGFGSVQRRLDTAHTSYIDRKQTLIDGLLDVRDQYIEILEETNRDLSARRAEYDQILTARGRLVRLFDQHQTHLAQVLNALLVIYRDANRRARKAKPPARFAGRYDLPRIPVEAEVPDLTTEAAEVRAKVGDAQRLLVEEITAIHREFDTAVARYHQIDDLVREELHVQAA
jgi:hypothetical protein